MSAGSMGVQEREPVSALQSEASRPVPQEVESKQRFEVESPGQVAPVSGEPIFGPSAAVVVGPAIRREAARHTP